MAEHMKLSDMPQFCEEVKTWLKARYGEEKGIKLWEATGQQYNRYLEELPDYGGKKSSHALAIYGSIVIFSMYQSHTIKRTMLPDTISRNARMQNLRKNIILCMYFHSSVIQIIGESARFMEL